MDIDEVNTYTANVANKIDLVSMEFALYEKQKYNNILNVFGIMRL